MFEAPPQKPSAFAGYWLLIIGCVGGGAGLYLVPSIVGLEKFDNDFVMIGSFMGGALVAVSLMWRVVMPRQPGPRDEE